MPAYKKTIHLFIFFLFLIHGAPAAELDTIKVFSTVMDRNFKAVVVTPEQTASQKAFPVVYLLHGYSGSYRDWAGKADLRQAADRYGFIIVCPDGGYSSWYLDSPVDATFRYETYIIKELIPFIKKQYDTADMKHAVCGLSMGGHGALYLAARNPDCFAAAGSMSGGVDLTYSLNRWDISKRLGSYEEFPERWHSNSVINMIGQLKKAELSLIIDCGVDDFFIDINRRLHQKLMKNNIDHHYIERPGKHSWEYWTNALDYHLLFFEKSFDPEK